MTMLLYKTAAAPLTETDREGWFAIDGFGGVIEFEDAKHAVDDLTSGPETNAWTLLDDAKVVGLHDDEEVTADDPRFNYEADETSFAVVRAPDGDVYLLMAVNMPEALLMPAANVALGGRSFEFGGKQPEL
jgi:hypothetical protein